jgi:hypothetical protein
MGTVAKVRYEADLVEWTAYAAEPQREPALDEVNIEHLLEEIEDLGKSERLAVRSHLQRMLMHRIKEALQPERGAGAGASPSQAPAPGFTTGLWICRACAAYWKKS